MQEEKLILAESKDPARCVSCDARNYGAIDPARGERVDKLYELKIGGQVLTLCDKCLYRLREMLAQRFGAENENKTSDGQIVLFTGTEFTARDKLGQSYRYRMIGAEVTHDSLIRLLNLDTGLLAYVEPAWFRERKIKVVQKGGGPG